MADATTPPSQADDQSAMQGWRERIDEIDLILVQLFNERTQCAIEIGHIKKRPMGDHSMPRQFGDSSSGSSTRRAGLSGFTPASLLQATSNGESNA